MGGKMHMVGVERVCRSKTHGGLGIIETGTYFGLIFQVLTEKSVWVQWTKEYSPKREVFWTMVIPSDCLWVLWGV